MDAILKWLSAYSLPVVILLAIGGAFLFVFQKIAEKAVAQAFDRHAKALELRLTRRSAFEEKILTDRYAGSARTERTPPSVSDHPQSHAERSAGA